MNISVTSLKSPFSFFCLLQENVDSSVKIDIDYNVLSKSNKEVIHGQYVAVFWQNKWVRGVVTEEKQFLIWLIDYGIYLRPTNSTIFVALPTEYKKIPAKVFEASIHGVVPVEKLMNDECEITNSMSLEWSPGAVEIAQKLIDNAVQIYFIPIALLDTKQNNIIIGDLYLKNSKDSVVNIVDELEKWPVFLEKDKEGYIKNLSTFYNSRKKHRACIEKPHASENLPIVDLHTLSINSYSDLVKTVKDCSEVLEQICDDDNASEVGSTVIECLDKLKEGKKSFQLTAAEIEEYSTMTVNMYGKEYNALQVLLNKMKDLEMCEKYQNCVSVGRALSSRLAYKKNM